MQVGLSFVLCAGYMGRSQKKSKQMSKLLCSEAYEKVTRSWKCQSGNEKKKKKTTKNKNDGNNEYK